MPTQNIHRTAVILIALFAFLGGLFVGKKITTDASRATTFQKINVTKGNYDFINPVLAFEVGTKNDFPGLSTLRKDFEEYIRKNRDGKNAKSVSVYFRDLNTGEWTGVREDKLFLPGSLMKVLLMIAYYKEAEAKPNLLKQKLYLEKAVDLNQLEHYPPASSLASQQWYSVEQLIERMIVDSGNNSTYVLAKNLRPGALEEVAEALGIDLPAASEDENFLSAKSYSILFRVLYNATYLSGDMSEKALSLLAQSTFTKGLANGLPKDYRIAHKFGERIFLSQTTKDPPLYELHDCGIIYRPKSPYFLCVMTKGREFDKLERIISDISRMTFRDTEKVSPQF